MRPGFYRETVRGEGSFPKGYVRALLSVSARHSLTSARAWIIPEQEKHVERKFKKKKKQKQFTYIYFFQFIAYVNF